MKKIIKQKVTSKKPIKQIKTMKLKRQYRATYDDLYSLPDDKLDWYIAYGFPEERDMARDIKSQRKMMKLAIYGY